jgi:uncharacterized protein YprB with RNaseH-like and TPR domain
MAASLDPNRLRRMLNLRPSRVRPRDDFELPDVSPHILSPRGDGPLAELVPGEVIENTAGVCYVATRAYPLAETRGPAPLGDLLDLPPALFHPFHPQFRLADLRNYRGAIFLDTETTGLGGGAGVYCFMVGLGSFEPWPTADGSRDLHFVVRQYFMRNPVEERALLVALDERLAAAELTVTFNGRTFDLPLLRSRYRQNRRFLPSLSEGVARLGEDRPHLDLLHPARRLWRQRLQSCRLINLEQQILGLMRSEDDVPGRLIPELYLAYVQSGLAGEMRRVFYHNLEDIVTMVGLADQLSRAFGETPALTLHVYLHDQDLAALGRAYEAANRLDLAESYYRRALETAAEPAQRADLFGRLAGLQKRQGRWADAADTWQAWLTSVPNAGLIPYVELAKYCEWQLHDLAQAEMWTAWALHTLAAGGPAAYPGVIQELQHRLDRLRRKQQGSPSPAVP